ncbi:hypothetical protein Tco_0418380, partial [Tanacetum coccineum]
MTTLSEVNKKLTFMSSAQKDNIENQCLLQMLNVMGLEKYIIKAFQDPTDNSHGSYIGPFRVLAKVGKVAYKLELTQELSRVHHTFQMSNLKKCYADEPLVMPLEGIHVEDKLQFVEEPVEIMEREIKQLNQSRIPLIKVRWNSRRGPDSPGNVFDGVIHTWISIINFQRTIHS